MVLLQLNQGESWIIRRRVSLYIFMICGSPHTSQSARWVPQIYSLGVSVHYCFCGALSCSDMQFENNSLLTRVMFSFSEWLVHFCNSFDLLATISPTAGLIHGSTAPETCSDQKRSVINATEPISLILDHMVHEWIQLIDYWMLWT